MSSLINTASANRRHRLSGLLVLALCVGLPVLAQELTVPASVTAGSTLSIPTSGSGQASFSLVGPGSVVKRKVTLGEAVGIAPEELSVAGRYVALLCSPTCRSSTFFVHSAETANLAVLVHPSRAPVGLNDVVSAVGLRFDKFRNLVLAPGAIEFRLTESSGQVTVLSAASKDGIAWVRTNSGHHAGPLQVTARVGTLTLTRVVQLVASDPCNLRIKAQRTAKGVLVETEPVRDCAGNPVPDGTIVSFTQTGAGKKDTVDAPIKQGVARAFMAASGASVISVASGVVMGNEIRMGGQ